jgi:hypothetical protein
MRGAVVRRTALPLVSFQRFDSGSFRQREVVHQWMESRLMI